ncbi:hypothetical protein [Mesorhizobium sp. NPDC059025]|uniref:hypothetical protein n=1 Tax=unclassified Mesorhizobium TaxID=325217 RepID=UPI003678654E
MPITTLPTMGSNHRQTVETHWTLAWRTKRPSKNQSSAMTLPDRFSDSLLPSQSFEIYAEFYTGLNIAASPAFPQTPFWQSVRKNNASDSIGQRRLLSASNCATEIRCAPPLAGTRCPKSLAASVRMMHPPM